MPSASLSRRISWPTTPSEIGSSPANGSSYITSIGSSAIARASATRRAMPPESSEGISCAAPRRPTACSFISTRSRISSSGRSVCSRIAKAMFSYTVMSVNSAPNWNSMPNLRRSANSASRSSSGTDWPATSHPARPRRELPADEAQDRRLAAARPAHDRDHLAARNPHRDAVEDRPPVVAERHRVELDEDLGRDGGRRGSGAFDSGRHGQGMRARKKRAIVAGMPRTPQ